MSNSLVSARGKEKKKKKRVIVRKTENKLQDPKQHITNKEAFCFAPLSQLFSSPRVRTLIRCGKRSWEDLL